MTTTQTQTARILVESKYGDYTTIAKKHGYTAEYVRKIANGKRNNDAVVASFIELLDSRLAGQQPE